MIYKKKTYREKLNDSKDLPKVVKIEGKMTKKWGTGTCAIAAPLDIDKIMKKTPKGKVTTINNIRKKIAKKYKATITCPITTGIFANISAHAADEEEKQGKNNITPYWRTLKGEGELNPKYPGGIENQKKRLQQEGFKITPKGKDKFIVENFKKYLV